MTIVSWNLKIDNIDQIKSLSEVLALNPDVICLQEATQETIATIRTEWRDWDIFECLDCHRSLRSGVIQTAFLCILTKHDIEAHESYKIHCDPVKSLLARRLGIKEAREFQFIDVKVNNTKYRIFNVHLEVASGSIRRQAEFAEVLSNFDEARANLVCGDFNIFTRPILNLITGWAFGFSLREYLVNERRVFTKLFAKSQLTNVFKRRVTYPRFRLQLDHILVPVTIKYENHFVARKTFGSDHKFLSLKILN